MLHRSSNPLLSLPAIFLVGLSLSIGWGIRGNYGHETGAMFPGALAAIAACVLSGRSDWRDRVGYFALFGMLGWAFGGSISYMMVIGYTHSGHEATQLFGFGGLFFIGFLWAALGGAGTALPAVLDSKRLNEIFKPLVVLLMVWVFLHFLKFPLMQAIQSYLEMQGIEDPMQRQERALYWLDSDWFEVSFILCGILLFDLVERRFEKAYYLLLFSAVGAVVVFGLGVLLGRFGGNDWIGENLFQYQGMYEDRYTEEQLAVTNWPPVVLFLGSKVGWYYQGGILAALVGLLVGVAAYFLRFGKFRYGSSLFLHMAVGWFVGFLVLPVLGSLFFAEYGGLRMTPPRSDNWAGVLGTFAGATIYFLRNNLKSIVLASVVCGAIGGVGFSGIAWLRAALVAPGNPHLSDVPAVQEAWTEWQATEWEPAEGWMSKERMPFPAFVKELAEQEERRAYLKRWSHWQGQNWHSFLEQSYGFVNGVGVAIALGLLLTRVRPLDNEMPRWRWTHVVAITFALPVLTYVNAVKNVRDWTQERAVGGETYRLMPEVMKAPWIDFELSALGWFNFFFFVAAAAFVCMMFVHLRRPLAIVPSSWVGRGQLLFFLLVWAFIAANFTRALPGFRANRLLTEGIILVNAVIATVLLLLLPREDESPSLLPDVNFGRWLAGAVLATACLFVVVPLLEWKSLRAIYGDAHIGHSGMNYRFGPNANWKREPLLKGQRHR